MRCISPHLYSGSSTPTPRTPNGITAIDLCCPTGTYCIRDSCFLIANIDYIQTCVSGHSILLDYAFLNSYDSCALQYILLHLLGYKLSLDDLKQFRQLGSLTPGHPEAGHTDGIELTTGPLGQGISSSVGLAIAQAHMGAVFNRDGFNLINNYTYGE